MSPLQKLRFLFSYFAAKAGLLFTVYRPKWRFFLFEWRYSITNLVNTISPGALAPVLYFGPEILETTWGKFQVRSGSQDAAIVSPAFEAADFKFLFSLLDSESQKSRVQFWDVGANIGAFSVRVGVHTRGTELKVLAFEPVADNQSVLKRNFELNELESSRVMLMPFGLGERTLITTMNFSKIQPGDAHLGQGSGENFREVQIRRADEAISEVPAILIMKIDVEGHEQQVLEGMKNILARVQQCWLCIEDIFEREALSIRLHENGFRFVSKFTPYNSWWHYKSPR